MQIVHAKISESSRIQTNGKCSRAERKTFVSSFKIERWCRLTFFSLVSKHYHQFQENVKTTEVRADVRIHIKEVTLAVSERIVTWPHQILFTWIFEHVKQVRINKRQKEEKNPRESTACLCDIPLLSAGLLQGRHLISQAVLQLETCRLERGGWVGWGQQTF